jgi:para-nitrobenzyl esterase
MTAVVRVSGGLLRGDDSGPVLAFRGIPYAAAPVGPLRWRPPEPVPAWSGVRDALDFAHQSPQLGAERPSVYASWANPRPTRRSISPRQSAA